MKKENILHLCVSGDTGGIEKLMCNYSAYSHHNNYFCFVWAGGSVAEEMSSRGAKVICLGYARIGPWKALNRINEICKKNKITVVVAHHASTFLQGALLCAKLCFPKIKTIMYVHSNIADKRCAANREKNAIKKTIEKITLKQVHGVVAISNSVKQAACHYARIPEKKVCVIYNGIPIPEVQANRGSCKVVRIIYVGRLIADKGVQLILDALAKLDKEIKYEFTVVGDGPYRDVLKRKVEQLALSSHVGFLGDRKDVPELLAQRDIFIHMPIWEEGFGITVVEAMAAGCICVCAAKGGIPEIITDGIDGYLVNTGRAEDLAEVLCKIIPQYLNGECEAMRNSAILRAKEFSIQNYSRKLDGYLTEIRYSGRY